jgi:hypothetical protein
MMVIKGRKELLASIKSIQQLMPGKEYDLYIKQAQQKHLDYIPRHRFLPAMDENSPKSLNDVELSVLSLSKRKYFDNIFTPIIVERQAHILIDKKGESKEAAVSNWTETIRKIQTIDELKKTIEKINLRKKSSIKKKKVEKSFWDKIFG